MRQVYRSPRPENIDRLVALMAQHGIETVIHNRSNYNHPGYKRFSYLEPDSAREKWEEVWISRPDDYTRAREIMRDIGLEPTVKFELELAQSRQRTPAQRRKRVVTWSRQIMLLAVLIVATIIAAHRLGWF